METTWPEAQRRKKEGMRKHTQSLQISGKKTQVQVGWRKFTWRVSGFWAWICELVCGFLSEGVEIRVSLPQRATLDSSPSGECYYRSIIHSWISFLKPEKFWILDGGFGAIVNGLWPFFATYQSKAYKHTRFHSQNDLLLREPLSKSSSEDSLLTTSPRPAASSQLDPKAGLGILSGWLQSFP